MKQTQYNIAAFNSILSATDFTAVLALEIASQYQYERKLMILGS